MTDMGAAGAKTPWHLWAVGILTLLWNAVGAFDYFMTVSENEQYLSQFTEEQLAYFLNFPTWVVWFWAIAVWGAILGSVLLLLKSRFAYWVFVVSLLAMLVTAAQNYLMGDTNMLEIAGPVALVFSAVIVIVGLLEIWYARAMIGRGVLK